MDPKKRILVVEDDVSVRTMLARALSTRYDVIEACDGSEAIRVLKSGPAPDVIITDVMMPNMNGYALSRLLKLDPALKSVPIIFLTGRTSAKDLVEGINAGARHYISKPFGIKDMLAKIGKILK